MISRLIGVPASVALISTISFAFYGCGLGSDMDVGNDRSGQTADDAGSTGGAPTGAGGATASTGGTRATGGAPSAGVQCGKVVCAAGLECCNSSCGTCVPPGSACDAIACVDPTPPVQCGNTTCPAGKTCCNASCGMCAGPGEGCTQQFCGDPTPVQCGKTTCAADQICCSASCGICGSKGGACPAIACDPVPVNNCTTDKDCHTAADYCTGCDCLGLGAGEKVPACSTPGVECLLNPCQGKTAVCKAGTCTAE